MSDTLLRFVVDDIAKDLKQTFDDKKITKSQITYYVLLVGNRMKAQKIEKRDSGNNLKIFAAVPVETVAVTDNPNTIAGRKRIILPKSIYDFNKDGGIKYISYWRDADIGKNCPPRFGTVNFVRTAPDIAYRLYYREDEEPTPANPYFYVAGDSVYFLGIEKVPIATVEVGLYSTLEPITSISLDQPFDFPEENLLILKRQVLDLARFSLQIPEERINEGEGDVQTNQIPTQKIVSVNDPINKSE